MRRNWQHEARIAIDELKRVGHGDREREMQLIARSLSGHNDTSALRRAISSYEFLLYLQSAKPVEYESLKQAPLSIVSLLARWHAFDPPKALSVAGDWGRGVGTVRSIMDAMNAARPQGYAGKTGAAFAKAYLAAAKPVIAAAVGELTDMALSSLRTSVKDPQTGHVIDFLFELTSVADGKKEWTAVLVVGPYNNQKLYSNRCADWVTKSFGLAWFYDRIVLALPDNASVDEYRRRTEVPLERSSTSAKSPQINVIKIQVDPFTVEEHGALSRLK